MIKKRAYAIFLFLITLMLFFPTNVKGSGVEWNNCCDVTVNQKALDELYQQYIIEDCPYTGADTQNCAEYHTKKVSEGKALDKEGFKEALIDKPKQECEQANKEDKKAFEEKGDGKFYFGDDLNENPFNKQLTIDPYQYRIDPPEHYPSIAKTITISSSPFNYLTRDFESFKERYLKEYNRAYPICEEKSKYKEYFDNDCMEEEMKLTPQDKELYDFYSSKHSYYIDGLHNCLKIFSWHHDRGLINFPGEPQNNCDNPDEHGCCPGTHYEKDLDICCPKGYIGVAGETSPYCALDTETGIVKTKIILSKEKLLLDGKDEIEATITYYTKDPSGNIIPYADKNILGVVAEADTSALSFSVQNPSKKTDKKGEVQAYIKLKKAQQGLVKLENTTVKVFAVERPDDNAVFSVSYGDGIRIESIEKISKGKIWQGAGAKFKVTVDDPLNEKKIYKFTSKSGFRIDEKTEDYAAFKTTKDNEVTFGWFAPKISKKVKIQYAHKLAKALAKIGMVVAEDIGSKKLEEIQSATKAEDVSENLKNVREVYDKMNKVIKPATQGVTGAAEGISLIQEANAPYQTAQKGIEFLLWTEGTIGILGKPATPLLTTLKAGLTGVDEWYNLVNDMDKIAKSKKITLETPLTVSVEGLETGSNDTKTITVPVEGFEMVLS